MSDELKRGARVKVTGGCLQDGERGTIVKVYPDASYMVFLDGDEDTHIFQRHELEVHVEPEVKRIRSQGDLLELRDELGVRFDWHEPSEVGVTAEIGGKDFDNAGFWYNAEAAAKGYEELYVRLYREGDLVAVVNLATLFAFATGYEG